MIIGSRDGSSSSIPSASNAFQGAWKSLFYRPNGQIGELDGLRAFAVLLVIATHCGQAWSVSGGAATRVLKLPFVQGGWVGVDLFFCLSGFFIGRQLWKELAESGTVRIGRFILRRGFRIWPLYYSVFLIYWLSQMLTAASSARPASPVWPELFLVSNYFHGYWVPGSWSLSTEEQFYLLIPVLILILSRTFKSLSKSRLVFVGLFLLAPVIRWLVWQSAFHPGDSEGAVILNSLYFPFHTHLDGLITGMFLANLSVSGRFQRQEPNLRAWLTLGCAILVGIILKKVDHVLFEYTSLSFFFGGMIWFCLNSGPNPLSRILAWRGFYVVSRLSYGMYLLHQMPLHRIESGVFDLLPMLPAGAQFALLFVVDTLVTMVLAFAGFALIELPFLHWRHQMGLEGQAMTPATSAAGGLKSPRPTPSGDPA